MRLIAIIAVVALNIGCGQRELGSQTSTQVSEEIDPVLVVMGGNSSCRTDDREREASPYGMRMYEEFSETVAAAVSRFGIEPRTIVTCYHNDSPTVSYITSDDTDTIGRLARMEFHDMLEAFVGETAPLILAGHSYGGWLNMKSAVSIAENRKFTALLTIDPISRVDCGYIWPFGCQRSPRDISDADLELIESSSLMWHNVYQTETFYLHSSPISQANENEEIDASHGGIARHERTWEIFAELIELGT